jgi:NADH dehydrogenase
MSPLKKIVILGAGFGGLRAAILISRKIKRMRLTDRYEVVLVDRNEHHMYTPLLYEVATTSKETANIHELHSIATYNIRGVLRGLPVQFIQAEVSLVDLVEGDVHLSVCPSTHSIISWEGSAEPKVETKEKKIRADYLVLALGAETNYFDIPGLKEYALPLKTMKDALVIRDQIYARAMDGEKNILVVVGGAGPTGVELAGELKEWCGELSSRMRCNLDVTLVQSAPSILPGFPPKVIELARARLKKFGVQILENQKISGVKPGALTLQSGQAVPFDMLIWTGGVKAPALLARTPLKMESRGRAEVLSRMECLPQTPDLKLHGKIYGLGDSICFYHPVTKTPVPGVARAALSQATVVAHNILEDIKAEQGLGAARHKIYKPRNYPYITPVGGKYAIAKIGPFVISGFFGWVLKGIVELNYLLSILPLPKAFIVWITGLHVFIQNDRLG